MPDRTECKLKSHPPIKSGKGFATYLPLYSNELGRGNLDMTGPIFHKFVNYRVRDENGEKILYIMKGDELKCTLLATTLCVKISPQMRQDLGWDPDCTLIKSMGYYLGQKALIVKRKKD